MNTEIKNTLRRAATALCFLGFASTFAISTAKADAWDKKTILTVNEPIQVRETVLRPGQYVFKLLDSQSDRHIVQIFNADQSHIITTELAIPNYRLQPTGHSRFTFYETPSGYVKAMRAWFYPGDNFGQEFPRPKHLELAMVKTTVENASVRTTTTEENNQVAEAAPAEQPAPEVQAEQPVEVAQNEPPPAPAPVETPAAPASEPTTLPKTATEYPLFGLAGIASLVAGLFLRRKQNA